MACCAIFVFLIGGFVSLYRCLFRRGPETGFAPMARRAAPGIVAESSAVSGMVVHESADAGSSPWRHVALTGLALLAAAGFWHLGQPLFISPAHADLSTSTSALTQTPAWKNAAPYSALWCSVICSPLCPRQERAAAH